MEEAITNAVPLVVMPFFGDQPINAKKMVDLGIAKEVSYRSLDKETFKGAILEVAQNEK